MWCLSCNTENPPDFSFCGHCGAPLPRLCPHCGLENPHGFSFCGHCGADLSRLSPALLQAALEGERRFVVVLFADIAGFTRLSEQLDAEEATTLVNLCLEQMTDAVVQHGGRVDKYTGDGLMAVFGAPTAYEDDPERALRSALVMRRAVDGLKLDIGIPQVSLHIGLACGQVVAAGVGGRGRREYTVMGTSVNLAARLEGASVPGQILASEELARITGHIFSFRPVILPHLQGWEGEVRAFELLDEQSGATPSRWAEETHSPLVGRDAEMALLCRSLEELISGKGGIVSVIGEGGVGKSRLLREVRAQARERGLQLTWLEGNALETGEAVRYGCFRTLLREAISATGQADVSQTTEQLQTFLEYLAPGRSEELYPCLGRVLGIPLEPEASERLERLDGESLKRHTFRMIQEWITALVERGPTVLVFEDLYRVDPTSAELLEQILPLAERTPLLIVWLYRPEPDRPVWHLREVAGREHGEVYAELWLRPLPSTAAERMIGHLLGTGRAPQEMMGLILRRAEGNPLFIEEIVRSVTDEDILVRGDEGFWELAPDWTEVAIPDTIQGIIQARVDQLDSGAKRVLQVAACIGRRFSYELLAAASDAVGVSQDRLNGHLRALEEATLIQRESGAPEGEYAFKHVLVRDTLHSSLLRGRRSQFHAAVACWYEEHTLDGPEPPYDLLSYHYEQTDNYEKQRLYFTRAGHQAARGYANSDACAFFTKALALTINPAERFELLLARERALDLMSNRVQQRTDLEELLQLADQDGDDLRRATVYNRLAYWHDSQGDYTEACATAEKGLSAARQAGDAHAEAGSLHRLASAAWRQARFTAALEAAQAALEIAHAAGDTRREAHSLTTIGVVHRSLGELVSARACYRQALDIRRATGDRKGEAISLSQLGNVFYDEGDYTGAFDHHQQALDCFRLVGDRQGEAWSLSGLGTVYLTCGDYEAARTCYEEALSLRRAVGDQRGEAVALSDLGRTLLALGEPNAAQALLEKAMATLRAIGARRDEVYTLTHLARAYEELGNLDGAQVAHQAALSRRRGQGQSAAGVENVADLARVVLARGYLEAARVYTGQVLAHIREHGLTRFESPFLVYLTCVRVLEACGEEEAARETLEEAYEALSERAKLIADPVLRRSFLERVPEHREIVAAWRDGVE